VDQLLAIIAEKPAASSVGLVGILCFAAWPLFRSRSMMLAIYLGNNLAFAAHYALLDHWTAAAMNGVMAAQTLAAIWIVRSPQLRWIYYALIPLLAALSLATWHGLPSFLAAMATAFSTIGRMQGNETIMRVLLLASTPFWAAHDLAVGSLPGLIADFLSMAIGTTRLCQRCPAIGAAAVSVANTVRRARGARLRT
jgi:hypothetical protein